MVRWVVVLTMIVASGLSALTGVYAQPASPAALGCQAAPIVEEPQFPQIPNAAASPAGSPVAPSKPPAAVPVAPELAVQIEDVTLSLVACISSGDAEGVAALTTTEFLGDVYGGGQRLSHSDFLALAQSAPVIATRIVQFSAPVFDGMRTVSADVQLVAGNQLRLERWTYLFREIAPAESGTPVASASEPQGSWLAHRSVQLPAPAPADANHLSATVREYTISLASPTIEGPNVVIAGRNTGSEPHELLLLQLDEGAEVESLLRPTTGAFPPDINVVGQVSILPGASADLVLVDLAPGAYTIVCLFPDESGVPHLAYGQQVELTIQ